MMAMSPNRSISFRDVGYARVLMVSFLSVVYVQRRLTFYVSRRYTMIVRFSGDKYDYTTNRLSLPTSNSFLYLWCLCFTWSWS